MESIKVIVTGDFSSGKTQFIKTLTGNPVTTERKVTEKSEYVKKSKTTVALDYGKIILENKIVHLFGTPGQKRFDFMWEVLDKDKSAFILLVDSTDKESIENSKFFLKIFQKDNVPFIIGCNKQDLPSALSVNEIRSILDIDADYIPLVAKDREKSMFLLRSLIKKLLYVHA